MWGDLPVSTQLKEQWSEAFVHTMYNSLEQGGEGEIHGGNIYQHLLATIDKWDLSVQSNYIFCVSDA